jgi:hypothetical protein
MIMRRLGVVPAAAAVLRRRAAAARGFHHKSLQSMGKDDPFGETHSWDNDSGFGSWKDVNVDALLETLDNNPDVAKSHFGPAGASMPFKIKMASRVMNDTQPRRAPDAYKTYAEAAAAVSMDEDEEEEDDEPVIPDSIMPPTPEEEAAAAATSPDAPTPDAAGALSRRDPLTWSTAEVVAWLRRYGPPTMDDDMDAAFHMVGVNGDMLLNRINPPDMFKEMRKWHKRRDDYVPAVSVHLLQETVIMAYPYCK